MIPNVARYKSVQVGTSSPAGVLIMLFDGLFRFLEDARAAMAGGDRARAGSRIGLAHNILSELAATFDVEASPELGGHLVPLYVFCGSRLIEANAEQDASKIGDVSRILRPIRDAFAQAAGK